MTARAIPRRRGLAPVVDARTRVLILGSFPGEASLAARQYYAHPRNHFWPILAEVLGEPLMPLPYEERLARIAHHGVGLWDVIVACRRPGSLDASIRSPLHGDTTRIRVSARSLMAVAFNGVTAARRAPAWAAAGYDTLQLPSTSPAHTQPFADKLAAWRAIAGWL